MKLKKLLILLFCTFFVLPYSIVMANEEAKYEVVDKNEIYEIGNCQCRYGYYGKNCDEVDECKDVNCNYGYCIDYIGKFACDCDFFFKGLECDEKEVYFYLFLLIGFLISCFLIKYLLYCLMQCINNCGTYTKLSDETTTENS